MKLMKIIFLTLTLGASFNSFSYAPTLDSLLRNGNNQDIGKNTVVANLYIREVAQDSNDDVKATTALKMVIFNENEIKPKLIQVDYAGGKVSSKLLIDVDVIDYSTLRSVKNEKAQTESEVFYALMSSLLNNNSNQLLELFEKNNVDIKRNKNLVNEEKSGLLTRYKRYLKEVKESTQEQSIDLANPLKPDDEDEKLRVEEILAKPYLKEDLLVKRVKEQNDFYWIVENEKLYIKFDKDHRLKLMKLITDEGSIEVICSRFVIQGSKLEFPEFIWIKDLSGRKYEITAKSLRMFSDNRDNQRKRIIRYQKSKAENEISDVTIKPDFLL